MIKHKELLSRLITTNTIGATVTLMIFLGSSRNITLFQIAWSMALFYGGFAILTVLMYNELSKRIEKEEKRNQTFISEEEIIQQKKELSQEEHSEESDTHKS